MKTRKCFTLVELLVVAGIIALLAGLILPAVIGGAQQGRITQAKSDMNSIQMALSQMDQTYHRMMTTTSSGDGDSLKYTATYNKTTSASVSIDSVKKKDTAVSGEKTFNIVVGAAATGSNSAADSAAAYKSLIAELTGTGRSGSGNITYNTNRRKIKFLEPKPNFNPSVDYTDDANKDYLWLDPWGNQYVIMICVDGSERIIKPDTWSDSSAKRYVMGKSAVYSFGPNGENNFGKNANEGGTKLEDDIATWHK